MPDDKHQFWGFLKLGCLVLLVLLLLRTSFGPVRGIISARSTLNVAGLGFWCLLGLAWARRSTFAPQRALIERDQPLWQLALVFALAVLPYLFVLQAPFVFDDYVHLSNAAAPLGSTLHRALIEHPSGGDGFFRPGGTLYFWLVLRLLGGAPAVWHLLGIVLHGLNSVMLLLLLRRFVSQASAAFGGALLFAWHGAHVEAVAWTAASFDLLATFFALLTLLLVTSSLSAGLRYATAAVAALAACLCKESALCLPLLVFCLAGMERDERRKEIWRAGLWVGVGCATEFLLRAWYLQGIGGYQTSAGSPMVLKVHPLGVVQALGMRLWALLLLPVNWSVALEPWLVIVVNGVLLLGALAVFRLRKSDVANRNRIPGFLIFTVCAALPVVPILMLGPDLTGARVLYLPSAGFCLLAAEAACVVSRHPLRVLIAISALQWAALIHNERVWVMETQAAARVCSQAAWFLRDHPQAELYAPDLPKIQSGVYFLANGFPQCVAASQPSVDSLRVHTTSPEASNSRSDYVGRWNAQDGQVKFSRVHRTP